MYGLFLIFSDIWVTNANLNHMIKKTLTTLVLAAASLMLASAQNPICPMGIYIADPTSRVAPDGNLYIYGSQDVTPAGYCSDTYHVLSSPDACNWTLHRDSFKWQTILYAPDLMLKDGTYYMYFCTPEQKEYVATGDSPAGPFSDAVQIEGPTQIDPAIFIDDDGQAYYYWGQFAAKGAKMNPDMKTLDMSTYVDSLATEKGHGFHEGVYMIKRGEYYYLVYADISRNHRPTCIGYSMGTSPLGPFEYKGVIVDNKGCDPEVWNDHGSIVELNGQWYVLYHRATHGCVSMRKACIEPIFFNEDGTIDEVEMTSQGAGKPLDAFKAIDGARACQLSGHVRIERSAPDHEVLAQIESGDVAGWKYVNFPRRTRFAKVRVKAPAGGKIAFRIDSADGPQIGAIEIPANAEWQEVTARIKKTKGVHALWMTFEGPTDLDSIIFARRARKLRD